MLKRLIFIATTLVLFSLFSINSYAEEEEIIGIGAGPTVYDMTVSAGQTMETTMVAYNPFTTNVKAQVIVSDNLKDYIQADPEIVFIEKHTSPENGKIIKLSVSVSPFFLGNENIQGKITLKGTGGTVAPAVGSTFYLHIKGMSILNLTLITIGIVLVIVAVVLFMIKRRKKEIKK